MAAGRETRARHDVIPRDYLPPVYLHPRLPHAVLPGWTGTLIYRYAALHYGTHTVHRRAAVRFADAAAAWALLLFAAHVVPVHAHSARCC